MANNKTRKATRGKRYAIHANYNRPFEVIVAGHKVTVMKNMDEFKIVGGKYTDVKNPPKEIFSIDADEVFIGKKSPTGGYDGLPASKADGNSILLRVSGNKYRYIGSEIYDFSPINGDKIIKYYSDIGNSDLPYPFAVGENFIYFMLEKVAVPVELLNMKKDPYGQYYQELARPEHKKDVVKMKVKVVQKRKL